MLHKQKINGGCFNYPHKQCVLEECHKIVMFSKQPKLGVSHHILMILFSFSCGTFAVQRKNMYFIINAQNILQDVQKQQMHILIVDFGIVNLTKIIFLGKAVISSAIRNYHILNNSINQTGRHPQWLGSWPAG